MVKEIQPKSVDQTPVGYTVFLAGTIDMGNSEDWQHLVIEAARKGMKEDEDMTFFNPRRTHGFEQSDAEMEMQINWELDHMEDCDEIFMFIAGTSKSPISLMELGIFSHSKKLVVVCEKNFYRYKNVEMVCKRYSIPLHNSLPDTVHTV